MDIPIGHFSDIGEQTFFQKEDGMHSIHYQINVLI